MFWECQVLQTQKCQTRNGWGVLWEFTLRPEFLWVEKRAEIGCDAHFQVRDELLASPSPSLRRATLKTPATHRRAPQCDKTTLRCSIHTWTILSCSFSHVDHTCLRLLYSHLGSFSFKVCSCLVGAFSLMRSKPMLSKYHLFVILPNKDIQSKLFIQTKY
jgi:hypothetical protein